MTDNLERSARAAYLLAKLVRIDSINPMGRLYTRSHSVEHHSINFLEELFAEHKDRVVLERQTCSEIHESLVISLGDSQQSSVALFESHIDTVPADDWSDRALHPVIKDDCLIGRGACDDKGCLTAMVLALLEVLEEGLEPPFPIVLLCAGDEEYAQTGIRHYVDGPHPTLAYAVFGEPTRLNPVIQHKGTLRWDITVHGSSAHSCRPELGSNAILGMLEIVDAMQAYQNRLQASWRNQYMTGPTITVTMIEGGRTRNAIPDTCTIAVDFRILPGMDPMHEQEALIEFLSTFDWPITHGPLQLNTPALSTDPKHPFCQDVLKVCSETLAHRVSLRGEPYGTDAAWVSDHCPAIVLGPGDICHAHAIDEQIAIAELTQAVALYKQIMLHPFQLNHETPQLSVANVQS